jgi:hypothetical protein
MLTIVRGISPQTTDPRASGLLPVTFHQSDPQLPDLRAGPDPRVWADRPQDPQEEAGAGKGFLL